LVYKGKTKMQAITASTGISTPGEAIRLLDLAGGTPGGRNRFLTYQQRSTHVCKFANVLKKFGVRKGDRVSLYLPMVPELPSPC